MATPVVSQLEWLKLWESGEELPRVFVNVWNCRAAIMVLDGEEYKDVTDTLENGEELAEEAVYAAGGAVNISGWYPPTVEILESLRKRSSGGGGHKK